MIELSMAYSSSAAIACFTFSVPAADTAASIVAVR